MELTSFDHDFFGGHLKKGAQLAAARRRLALGFTVWHAVEQRRAAGEPISKDMFDTIAGGLKYEGKPVGGTLASEAYREFKKRLPLSAGGRQMSRTAMSRRRGIRRTSRG